MSTNRIVIDETGAAFRELVTTTPIPNIASEVRKLFLTTAVRLPALTPDTWMTYDGKTFTCFRRILKLQLHCVWKPDEVENADGKIIPIIRPSFNATPSRGSLCQNDFFWETPRDMILLFISSKLKGSSLAYVNSNGDQKLMATESFQPVCGLVAVDTATKKLYRLPLPNTYDDGRLCTGELNAIHIGPWTQFQGFFASWSENQWNSDLIGHTQHKYKEMFLLDPNTMKPLPTIKPWQQLCFSVAPSWVSSGHLAAGLEGLV